MSKINQISVTVLQARKLGITTKVIEEHRSDLGNKKADELLSLIQGLASHTTLTQNQLNILNIDIEDVVAAKKTKQVKGKNALIEDTVFSDVDTDFYPEIEKMTEEELLERKKAYEKQEWEFVTQGDNPWMKQCDWKHERIPFFVKIDNSNYILKYLEKCTCKMEDIIRTQENLNAIFEYHEQYSKLYYDEFLQKRIDWNDKDWDEVDSYKEVFRAFREQFENKLTGNTWCPREEIKDTIATYFKFHHRNYMQEYIEKLFWDKTERLETFLQKEYGAEDTPLNRTYFKRWMIALIARIFNPGCKFDNVLLLQGEQGKHKSTLFTWLGELDGTPRFNEMPKDFSDATSVVYSTRGKYIITCDDFDDMCAKDELGAFKSFVTRYNTTAALKYKDEKEFKATYVIGGSTNQTEFLNDDLTFRERRFWIVSVNPQNISHDNLTPELRDQLFAEAYYWYAIDEKQKLYIWEPELIEAEIELQKKFKRASVDTTSEYVLQLFDTEFPIENGRFKSQKEFKKCLQEYLDWDNNIDMGTLELSLNKEKWTKISIIPWNWIYSSKKEIGQRSVNRVIQILHTNGIEAYKRVIKYNKYNYLCIIIKDRYEQR